ncbi:MAG: S8 family serine peptidase [Hyphomicrobium sp.]
MIVRFKQDAVEAVARTSVAARASPRMLAAAFPSEISGPITYLREEAGVRSMKPMFVGPPTRARPAGEASLRSLVALHGSLSRSATQAPRESLTGFQMVEISSKKDQEAVLKRLRAAKAVDFAEPVPNHWLTAAGPDPLRNRQWGLPAIRWFDKTRPDAADVHVAVLDSGIDEGHADLKDAIEDYHRGPNQARDFLGHGTHVSGIIAATFNNVVGITGVANCRLHCWKIFLDPPAGSTKQKFDFDTYSQGLAAILDSDIKVVNLSIGGELHSQTEQILFNELAASGVIVVAAMGNEFEEGNPIEYPAAYDGVTAIGAIDEVDRRASFSNTGTHIALMAPGANVLSTVPRQKASLASSVDYDSWSGTSMATPHVAGCAALLYAAKPRSKASADAIVKRLKTKARKVPAMKGKSTTKEYGHGVVDIAAAL